MTTLLDISYPLAALPTVVPQIINILQSYPIAAFVGEMGAGKTTLISALCQAFGVNKEVSSPTFSIIQEYYTELSPWPIFHLDLYRIAAFEELLDTGIEDVMETGQYAYMFIEWPQIAEDILPRTKTIIVQLSKLGLDARKLVISSLD